MVRRTALHCLKALERTTLPAGTPFGFVCVPFTPAPARVAVWRDLAKALLLSEAELAASPTVLPTLISTLPAPAAASVALAALNVVAAPALEVWHTRARHCCHRDARGLTLLS